MLNRNRCLVPLLLAICAMLSIEVRADETSLAEKLDAILHQHAASQRSTVTLKVLDLDSGEVLYDRGGARLLTPASNLKIYTSACALDCFGADHQFQTKILAKGTLQDGVLQGDLVLVGGGDAMLSSEDLATLADRVVNELQLRDIHGAVVVDNSRYGSPLKGPGWMWDDDPDYYNMSVTPLMVDFNVLEVKLTPREKGIQASLVLPASYPKIRYVPRRVLPNQDLATRLPFSHPILVAQNGNLVAPTTLRLTMQDPRRWVQSVFTEMLKQRGVRFSRAEETNLQSNAEIAAELKHLGPSLAKTLKHFNNASENAVGEVLLHEIAIAQGIRRPRWTDGAKVITDWLKNEARLEPDSFRLADGSGLSRYNLISADSSVRLLEFMHSHPHADTYFSALKSYPVEVDGKKQPLVAAKPGGMTGVSTISGYLKTTEGRPLAFSLLANGVLGSAEPVLELREKLWQELAKYQSDN